MSMNPQTRVQQLLLGAFLVGLFGLFATACGPKYPNCKNDGHCQRPNVEDMGTPFCIDNTCRECRDDSHCGRGQACNGGTCRPIPGYCDDEMPCPSPQVCRDNRCGPECLSDDECEGEFAFCEGGTCREGDCNTDDDCDEGFRCEAHMCRPIPDNSPCANQEFQTVYFDFDESALTTAARNTMDWNLACMERFEGEITIEGHCDERGTTEYNLALGERRARAARDFMTGAGVERGRLNTISYGESRPADPRRNESAYRQNRRAEFLWR